MRWLHKLPADLPLEQQSELILIEIWDYVTAHQKSRPKEDPTLVNVRSQLNANPRDTAALRQLGEYMQKLQHKEVTKRLRRFRHSAVRASGEFFQEPSSWLVRQFESSPLSHP